MIYRNLHIIPEGDLTALYTDFITHVIGLSRQYQNILSGEASGDIRK